MRDGKTEVRSIRLGSYGACLFALIHRVLWEFICKIQWEQAIQLLSSILYIL